MAERPAVGKRVVRRDEKNLFSKARNSPWYSIIKFISSQMMGMYRKSKLKKCGTFVANSSMLGAFESFLMFQECRKRDQHPPGSGVKPYYQEIQGLCQA